MIRVVESQYSIENKFASSTLEECIEYCKNKDILGLDIETTKKFNKYENEGLDPYLSKIVMVQIGDLDEQFIIDARHIDCTELFQILQDKLFVGHNMKFEYKHILHNYGIRLENIYDTYIVELVLYCGQSRKGYGLSDLHYRYLGTYMKKEVRDTFGNIGSKPFTTQQIEYGAADITAPLHIMDMQIATIEEFKLQKCVDLEMEFLKVLGDIEYSGMNFNQDKWRKTHEDNLILYQEKLKELDNWVLDNYSDTKFVNRQLDLFSDGIRCAVQWSSSKQVVEFFDYLGFCPVAKSKSTGKMSKTVKADYLIKLLFNDDFEYRELVTQYLKFKELEQATTTFGIGFFKYVNPVTQRLHSEYRQILKTGRISSSNPKKLGAIMATL